MKIGILSRSLSYYSTRRLWEEAKRRGYQAEVIDALDCYMNISDASTEVIYRQADGLNRPLEFDAVIPRIGPSITTYGTSVLRQFEISGVFSLNESDAILKSRDKLRSHQILALSGIPTPITSYAHGLESTGDLIDSVGGGPLVIKVMESTHGNGVILAETAKAAESIINAFREVQADFLVQEYIKEAAGCDIRCFVIGDQVVASMKRVAAEGEFRSNMHLGAKAQMVDLTPEERRIAVEATKAMGLLVSGVDIIQSSKGPLVLEVNSSPGLEGIENTTGRNIAVELIKYVERSRLNRLYHRVEERYKAYS